MMTDAAGDWRKMSATLCFDVLQQRRVGRVKRSRRMTDGADERVANALPILARMCDLQRPVVELNARATPLLHLADLSRRLNVYPQQAVGTTVEICGEQRRAAWTLALSITPLLYQSCLLYTSPSPRDGLLSRMPSSA